MPARDPGRALRSAAAELTRFADEDVEAILSELDPASRRRLTDLLEDYHRGDLPGATAPAAGTGFGLELAPWLAERLSGDNERRAWTMTPQASQTLARIAVEQGWKAPTARGPAGGAPQGLLARIGLR